MAFTEADGITEMTEFDVDRVDAVGSPANGVPFLLLKSLDVEKAKYSAEQLRDLHDKGHAMTGPNGQIDYPIDDEEDLHNAIHAVGRGKGSHRKIRAYIMRRAKEMGKTSEIPDDWAGAEKAQTEPAEKDAPDADAQGSAPSASAAVGLPADGDSDSLGDQSVDPEPLLGQTDEVCAPVTGTSDQQARQDARTQKEQSMTNPDRSGGEAEDVAIGQRTVALLRQALDSAEEFTNREEAEASDATKEIHMTQEELVALLAAAGVKPKAKKSAEEKAAKKEKKAAKKSARLDEIEKKLGELEERPRPFLAGAAAKGASPFAELEGRVAKAVERHDVSGEMTARRRLTAAKMIAIENGRERGDIPSHSEFSPNSVRLLTRDYEIGDDPSISGVG